MENLRSLESAIKLIILLQQRKLAKDTECIFLVFLGKNVLQINKYTPVNVPTIRQLHVYKIHYNPLICLKLAINLYDNLMYLF